MTRSGWSRRAVVAVALAVALAGAVGSQDAGGQAGGRAGERPFDFLERAAAREFVVASMVEVRLVGFRGQGGGAASLDAALLLERLRALRTDYLRAAYHRVHDELSNRR